MLLSAVYVLVLAQSSSEIPEGLMNNPVLRLIFRNCVFKIYYIFINQSYNNIVSYLRTLLVTNQNIGKYCIEQIF